MIKTMHLIEQARNDLLMFQPEQALTKLEEFERHLVSGRVSKECLEEYKIALRDIQTLAAAARDGVAAVQQQLTEIMTLSRSLDTYDREGRKIGNRISCQHEQRF
ncbi:hypothetical protein JWJ88_05625 [Paracoccus methylovorus]|uniref:Uncharacterized protein n=1 Tax=Paracoccus methylovorus TaxID=2812658 RepID=A0ABX7JHM5_9RHOB|nr:MULTISPECIES: hypothetical protein [Paracoccus]QRZ12132.1 hypothetical protein JWJ88_05625 [Paracoccus methylovorus]